MKSILRILATIPLLTTAVLMSCAPGTIPSSPAPQSKAIGTTSGSPDRATSSPTGSSSSNLVKGTLELRVTDAPARPEVTSVLVSVSKVEVHQAGSEDNATPTPSPLPTPITTPTPTEPPTPTPTSTATPSPSPAPNEDNGWVSIEIPGGSKTFDLLKIKGIEDFLGSSPLAVGKYTQIRLTVDKVDVGLDGNPPKEATLPSGKLKFVHPFEIKSGATTVVVLDFDAEKSVTITGNDKVIVKPVVKLITK